MKSVLSVDVVFEKPGLLDTETNPNYFVVWLWAGCRGKVMLDGKELPTGALDIPAFG